MAGSTAIEYKSSIERAAKAACSTWPQDPELRARSFCAMLSFYVDATDPGLAAALNEVAGISPSAQPAGAAQ